MNRRFLIVGLDCMGAEILASESLAELPNLRRLARTGMSGSLESTLPPITVPAWTSMTTGRDPGELGLYGFRNRRSFAYGDLVYATSNTVRYPRIWDYVSQIGGHSVVIGVPQTWPPRAIQGELVTGFEVDRASVRDGAPFTYPAALENEVAEVVGDYLFDVRDFRNVHREIVLEQIYTMTKKRFQLMSHFLDSRSWNFAMLCEIGPDRLHHCFWSDHDPAHPRHDSDSPHRRSIRQYYQFLDNELGRLLASVDSDTGVLVVSDHGAQPMYGGICINEILRQSGWLFMKKEPTGPTPLRPDDVDWSKSRAWGNGGYYARIFLNIQGREPQGIVPPDQRDEVRQELAALLSSLSLPDGTEIFNQVVWPERHYRRVYGLAPDLLVFFGGLQWRSIGTVGYDQTWLFGNDTGVDEANHTRNGFYVLAGRRVPKGVRRRASILDIAPTVLRWIGLTVPDDLTGRNLLAEGSVSQ